MIDNHGHGTHMAHLVFMTAEHVDVYVARVWDGEEVPQTASRVARAIQHAANPDQGWGVDIISLSLSLGKSPDRTLVEGALEYAKSKGALVFASASNNRHDRELEIGFPASAGELTICINSHNENSERSPYSPLPQPGRANLAVLGQGITAAWKDNSMVVQEGTSISTAVAAGIAAIVLDYARQLKTRSMRAVWSYDGQVERNGLRDIRVMKKIMFDLMVNNPSTEGHAYNILKPWILFKTDKPLRNLRGNILEDWEMLISSRLRGTYQECQDFKPGGLY
ncbi:peptidase S8/S53 domain-containing protein [Stachybotrys elegans]|uniref:Peptidase S8/S53 domain-containing protein n=1 Tax=Stachybotrys elegans TaxID=80388 RepID=A0A8K0SCB6_9HYPO|nr:peptidase S8/S53 domain-containing protein [Stachybotrys elegans]